MSAHALIAEALASGLLIWRDDDCIGWKIESPPAPADMLERLREHKPELLRLLPDDPEAVAQGRAVLARLANEHGADLRDLLRWYATDLTEFAAMPPRQARETVRGYLRERGALLDDPTMERRRAAVLRMLKDSPQVRHAAVNDQEGAYMRLAVGIRNVGTCELVIDANRWQPFEFLSLMKASSADS